MPLEIHHLTSKDVLLMEALLTTFGEAFNEIETYTKNRPSHDYLRRLLGNNQISRILPEFFPNSC